MPEWLANTPWWVVAGLSFTVLVLFFKGSKWFGATNTRLDKLDECIKVIGEDIKKILLRLPQMTFVGQSPVRLTEFGEKISAEIKAKEWVFKHALNLKTEIYGSREFEVFEKSLAYVVEQMDKDNEFSQAIRETAYQHGVDLEQIWKIYAIELRDYLLVTFQSKAET